MNRIFKKFRYMMIGLVAALITGCVKEPDKNQIVAQINNYAVTIEDFKHEAGMSISGVSKELILQDIVTKELLLQEAQKMGLDKNKAFMKEIEDYWKQSLIKRLINIKGAEFLAAVRLTDEEAKAGQDQDWLKMKKAQTLLELWINNLAKDAKIEKYDTVLNTIKLKDCKNLLGGTDGK